MKRMIGMVAAMALATSTAAYAQNTLVEIHQFFSQVTSAELAGGVGSLTPANLSTNPSITAHAGDHVYLAVWIRALQGNGQGTVGITGYNYEIAGQGSLASFAAGGRRQVSLGGSYVDTPGSPAVGVPAVTYNDGAASPVSPPIVQMFGLSGASSAAGSAAEINSSAAGNSLGAFMVQVIEILVSPTAAAGDSLNLYFTTPKTGGANYATSAGTAGSVVTTAFGATASGAMDQKRISNPTADIIGSLNDRVSTTPDAVITVPEPGTLGLLALGLLAIRRRRN